MNETLFSVASVGAMLGWLALGVAVIAPPGRLRASLMVAAGRWVPAALCALYAWLLVMHWGSAPGGGFSSLAAVQALFAVPGKVLGGWVHFLAFDLWVGHWMATDVLARGRARWPLLVLLPATFMYGPLGLLLYLATRLAGAQPSPAGPGR